MMNNAGKKLLVIHCIDVVGQENPTGIRLISMFNFDKTEVSGSSIE